MITILSASAIGGLLIYDTLFLRKRRNSIVVVRKYSEIIKNEEKTQKNG